MADDYKYLVLTDQEKNDIVVAFLLAQERDHFCHSINLDRYNNILKTISTDDPFYSRVQQLQKETVERLNEVTAILTTTATQLPADPIALSDSISRVTLTK